MRTQEWSFLRFFFRRLLLILGTHSREAHFPPSFELLLARLDCDLVGYLSQIKLLISLLLRRLEAVLSIKLEW